MRPITRVAEQLTEKTKVVKLGLNASIRVSASAFLTLGFEPGETITKERLTTALVENFRDHLNLAGEDVFDLVQIESTTDEA